MAVRDQTKDAISALMGVLAAATLVVMAVSRWPGKKSLITYTPDPGLVSIEDEMLSPWYGGAWQLPSGRELMIESFSDELGAWDYSLYLIEDSENYPIEYGRFSPAGGHEVLEYYNY